MIDDVGITFTLINPKRGCFFSPPGWHGAELQHGCAGDRGVVFLGSDWPFEVQPGSIQDPSIHLRHRSHRFPWIPPKKRQAFRRRGDTEEKRKRYDWLPWEAGGDTVDIAVPSES